MTRWRDRGEDIGPPSRELLNFAAWWSERPTMPEAEAKAGWTAARKAWLESGPRTLARINSLYEGDFDDGGEPDPRLARAAQPRRRPRGGDMNMHELDDQQAIAAACGACRPIVRQGEGQGIAGSVRVLTVEHMAGCEWFAKYGTDEPIPHELGILYHFQADPDQV